MTRTLDIEHLSDEEIVDLLVRRLRWFVGVGESVGEALLLAVGIGSRNVSSGDRGYWFTGPSRPRP